MLAALADYRQACPDWLLRVSDLDAWTAALKHPELPLRDSLVYPGSGKDWSPIRQMLGVTHSFVFLDCGYDDGSSQLALPQQIALGGDERLDLRHDWEFDCGDVGVDGEWFGQWRMYESGNGERASLMLVPAEAIEALALLYTRRGLSPRILVLREHGFGCHHWQGLGFGTPYEQLLVGRGGMTWPEFLVTTRETRWPSSKSVIYETLCEDECPEAEYRDCREIRRLKHTSLQSSHPPTPNFHLPVHEQEFSALLEEIRDRRR